MICIILSNLGNDDVQILPYIVFQLAYVDPFGAFGVVDKLRTNTACGSLDITEEFLFVVGIYRTIAAVINIIESGPIVIIILEELGIEWYSATALCFGLTSAN